MDSFQATNAPQYVTLAGRQFLVRQLSHREWTALQAWLKHATPNPLTAAISALAELEGRGVAVSELTRKAVLDHAHEESRYWPPRVGSAAWFTALNQIDQGPAQAVKTILAACGVQVSDDEAHDLFGLATSEEMGWLWAVALHGDCLAPKAMTGDSTTTSPPENGIPMSGMLFTSESEK